MPWKAALLVLGGLTAMGVLLWAQPVAAVPVEEGDAGIQKGDRVIAMYDCPLQEESGAVSTVPAQTELEVAEVKGDAVGVSLLRNGQPVKGSVQSRCLRTPAMLGKLRQLGSEYQDYALSKKPVSLPTTGVTIRRVGRPIPLPEVTISPEGNTSVKGVTHEDRNRLADKLDGLLRDNFTRNTADSPWVVLVVCERFLIHTASGRPRLLQYGQLFLLDTGSKSLVFQKAIAGEGWTDEALLSDFAHQAADDFGQMMVKLGSPPPAFGPGAAPTPFR